MSWPSPQEYNEAIQAPTLNFSDEELKKGTVDVTNLGLPRAITGGFASVYRVKCGNKDWAVRCFLREFSDQHHRYESISRHLDSHKLPFTVGFNFLDRGILVGGKWYPILKMEWVQGELLNRYIENNLHNPELLADLAKKWLVMLKDLQSAGISHGDLQHGNVLVSNGQFRLIDYDGMFVPALANQRSNEVGHRNYQHPQRTEFDFGPALDNFAAWVIYISIVVLSIDPGIWQQTTAGDECLLFRREDFDEPYNSVTLRVLSNHQNNKIDALASFFQSLLYTPPSQIPSFDSITEPLNYKVAPPTILSSPASSWLQDHLKQENHIHHSPLYQLHDSTWVIDFIQPPTSTFKEVAFNVTRPRIALGLTVFTVIATTAISLMGLIGFQAVLIVIVNVSLFAFLLLKYFYKQNDLVLKKIDLLEKIEVEQETVLRREGLVKLKVKEKMDFEASKRVILKRFEQQKQELMTNQQVEIAKLTSKFDESIQQLKEQTRVLSQEESSSIRRLQNEVASKISRLKAEIADSQINEENAVNKEFEKRKGENIYNYLSQWSLRSAVISGVGDKLKDRLSYARINTAADVNYWRVHNVEGIGKAKTQAIVNWRNQLEKKAQIPSKLSSDDERSVRSQFQAQRQQLENEKNSLENQLTSKVAALKQDIRNKHDLIAKQQFAVKSKFESDKSQVADKYRDKYAMVSKTEIASTQDRIDTLKNTENVLNELRQKLGEKHWQLSLTRKQLAQYQHVTFSGFLRKTIGM